MRALRLFILVLAVAAAAFLVWRWWTAPPRAHETELEAALAAAPSSADGALALAVAPRWMARHREALAPLAWAAPEAGATLVRLRGAIVALAAAARSPLVVWWSGEDAAVAARVDPAFEAPLREVAALAGAECQATDDVLQIASRAELLGAEPWTSPSPSGRMLAALARLDGRRWEVEATRDGIDAQAGSPPELPALEPSASYLVTRDLERLTAPTGLQGPHREVEAAAVLGEDGSWGLRVAGGEAGNLRRVLEGLGQSGLPVRWLGIWLEPKPDAILLASTQPLLEAVAALPEGEEGAVRGRDAGAVAKDLAGAVRKVPGLNLRPRQLEQAAKILSGIAVIRWRSTPEGARLALEW